MITISAFRWVPPFAQGQVRDLRARWALEEAGLPYRTRLLEQGDQDKPEYRAMQPFGQVPILEEDGKVLFETGAIEPHIMNVAVLDIFYADQAWAQQRRPGAREFASRRLESLANALGDKSYLDGDQFTAGDLMMTTVLRIIPELVTDPRLAAYVERCTARPAFCRAHAAQLGDFRQAA
jgi:glutathione S-transferase